MSDRRFARGKGHDFRRPGPVERLGRRFATALGPGPARRAATAVFDRALWLATAGRGLRAELPHGETIRLRPECRRTFWNLEEYEAFRSVIRDGDIVIDAGANVGAYTVLFARWAGLGGHVFAFEPVPAIARVLRAQLALNRLADRVTVVECAVGARAGSMTLSAPGLVGINRAAIDADGPGGLTVPTVSIDAFCAKAGVAPSVVKIDVEGAELDALRGGRAVLARARPGAVFVEFHPSLWPAYGLDASQMQRELDAQSLEAQPIRPEDDVWAVEGICARLVRRD